MRIAGKIPKASGAFSPLKTLTFSGLFAIGCITAYYSLLHDLNNDPYILADWLINYEDGGFKRRGLSGSFLFLVQDISGLPLPYLVFAVQLMLYVVFLYSFYRLLKNKILTFSYFVLIWSPVTLLFWPNALMAIGRKEIILFALFSIYAHWLNKKQADTARTIFILIGLAVASLMHELMFFFIPYFVVLNFVHSSDKKFQIKPLHGLFLLSVLLPAILLALLGAEINGGHTFDILGERGVEMQGGIIAWNGDAREIIRDNANDYLLYLIPLSYGLLMFFIYIIRAPDARIKNLHFLLLFCLVYSIPLFVLAVDWGRWLFIHFTLMLVLLGSKLKDETPAGQDLYKESRLPFLMAPFLVLNFSFSMAMCNLGFALGTNITRKLTEIWLWLL